MPPDGLDTEIASYYSQGKEQGRLVQRAQGRLEYLRTWEVLERFLPAAPATVHDIGGAAGIYAHPLAACGYRVHLFDPVPLHIEQARAAQDADHPLAASAVADARAIPAPDASADAVLMLGPLYHLPDHADRRLAISEAFRVLRPGGVLLAAAISRFGSLIDGLWHGRFNAGFWQQAHRTVADGTHRNPDPEAGIFTTAYFHRPDELAREVDEGGLNVQAVIGVEGPGWLVPDLESWLDDGPRQARLLEALRQVESEPSLLGASGHILALAHRP